jgi:FtsP/CotA-like multicopper oxidase with cupredoxin domain
MDNKRPHLIAGVFLGAIIFAVAQVCAYGQGVSTSSVPCPRFAPGSTITEPEDLFSQNGRLTVNFKYFTYLDSNGTSRFCFINSDNAQSPTLHVNPGDTLTVNVTNDVPADAAPTAIFSQIDKAGRYRKSSLPAFTKMLDMMKMHADASSVCGDAVQTPTSLNIHYHGTNTSPTCHSDEVIHTLINSGSTFTYNIQFPSNEPPGMYWYHPHVHGIAEAAVQGGASGAIVVEGIENFQPAVAGLPERILIIRDQPTIGDLTPPSPPTAQPGAIPSWDVTTNYTPDQFNLSSNGVTGTYQPAVIPMKPNEKQFWRVVNATADTILDLQLQYDGKAHTFQIVSYDGVPAGSQDGTGMGTLVPATDVIVPPAGRVEFIMNGPSTKVKNAQFVTLYINTGPAGDEDPTRPLGQIVASANAPEPPLAIGQVSGGPGGQLFPNLASVTPTAKRQLYFSENADATAFFITVQGQTPVVFSPTNPPAIVTTQGAVEDWTISNQATENHEFHMHQIHFLLMAINGVPVPPSQQQFYDMYQVPFWSGSGPFPSITVRMDFRGADIGDFVYHCHILGHEDLGMMAIIQVNPSGPPPPPDVVKPGAGKAASAKEVKTNEAGIGFVTDLLKPSDSSKAATVVPASAKAAAPDDKK